MGHPIGSDPERFHLVATYESDARLWETLAWVDQYSGNTYRVGTVGAHGPRLTARIKNYADVLREHEHHPEAKCADSSGVACGKQSVGLLGRRSVTVGSLAFIGKESNRFEQVAGQSTAAAYVEYPDPKRDEWVTNTLPTLKAMPLRKLMELSGMSLAALQAIRAGRTPEPPTRRPWSISVKHTAQSKTPLY
jgi:hypothetical protein